MKIIYDTAAPAAKRVIVIDDEGIEYPAGCFRISFELTIAGKPGDAWDLGRWGNMQKRRKIHESIQRELTNEHRKTGR